MVWCEAGNRIRTCANRQSICDGNVADNGHSHPRRGNLRLRASSMLTADQRATRERRRRRGYPGDAFNVSDFDERYPAGVAAGRGLLSRRRDTCIRRLCDDATTLDEPSTEDARFDVEGDRTRVSMSVDACTWLHGDPQQY